MVQKWNVFCLFLTYGTLTFLAAGIYNPNDVMYMSLADYSVMIMKYWEYIQWTSQSF